ncbi:LysR family transcriptional regulator [Vibrio sp. FNV 38]|nr:LysR family transcriptional regulator [Vibrio sp. FNV 38]
MNVSTGGSWKGVDLNLLVSFSFLYQHRSVSLAAEHAFVSQSAMSHSLNRLRILFDDPLFERRGYAMEPTEHAHHIAPKIEVILNSVSKDLLDKSAFSPLEYQGTCRIGLTDYAEFIFAPKIYDAIRDMAPLASVSFFNVNQANYQQRAIQSKLDVIIGSIQEQSERFQHQLAYTEEHVCLYDPKALPKTLSFDDFVAAEHALVSPNGRQQTKVDQYLAEHGLKRSVSVTAGHFLTIGRLLKNRKMVAIVPRLMAKEVVIDEHLTHIQPPIPVGDFDINLVWPTTKTSDTKNQWLRRCVMDAILGELSK